MVPDETAAAAGDTNPLIPTTTELILGAVAFFVVFGALGKVLLPRLQQTLEERTDAIEGGLQRAEEAQREAQRTLEQYRAYRRVLREEPEGLRAKIYQVLPPRQALIAVAHLPASDDPAKWDEAANAGLLR